MKKTLSLVLAMVMLMAMFVTAGAAEAPEAAGQPEPAEPAVQTGEAEVAAAPVEEAPAEPAPASEPVVEPEVVAEPEPVAEPEVAAEPEPASEVVAAAAPTPTAVPVVTWVELDCNGGSYKGYTRFSADVFDGNLHSTLTPVRDGYEFVGWYTTRVGDNPDGPAIHNGEPIQVESGETLYAGWKKLPKPADTTDNYKYGVWLHVVNGNFTGNYKVGTEEHKDISGAASVWVEFQDGTRKLPVNLPTATRTNGTFEGWYTQAPTEVQKPSEDKNYETWFTVTKNGTKIEGETPVPEGVQVLYAAFDNKETPDAGEKLVTFKLNWNGMFGKTSAMTCTRPYGSSFTPQDAAVFGLNYVYDDPKAPKDGAITWESLAEYWKDAEFDGYKFLGWSQQSEGGTIINADTLITDGMTFYAQCEKDGTKPPVPSPAPTPGPVETIRINAPHMTVRQDPSKTKSVTVSAFVTPVGGSGEITWTVEVPPTFTEDNYAALFGSSQKVIYKITKDNTSTKITKDGAVVASDAPFNAEMNGLDLVITPQQGCSQVLYVSAECNGKTTPAPATVVIEHTVGEQKTVVKAATCTAAGEEGFVCSECGEVTGAEALPATGHSFCGHARCEICGEAGKKGDPSGDGKIDGSDVRTLFQAAMNVPGCEVATELGDVTGDGKIDTSDVRVLYLAAMNVRPLAE